MLAAAANATATPAPGRHRRFANGFSRRPFRYPARDMGVVGCRMVSGLSNTSGWRMILARGRQEKLVNCWLVAIAPRLVKKARRQRASSSFRSGTAQAPPVARSESARFRRARWLTRQFATGSSPARCIAQASFRSLPSTRPQICRDSQVKSVRSRKGISKTSSLRSSRGSNRHCVSGSR